MALASAVPSVKWTVPVYPVAMRLLTSLASSSRPKAYPTFTLCGEYNCRCVAGPGVGGCQLDHHQPKVLGTVRSSSKQSDGLNVEADFRARWGERNRIMPTPFAGGMKWRGVLQRGGEPGE